MSKVLRKTLKMFGLGGPVSSFGQFGSKALGSPQTSQDPDVIQQLLPWDTGWQDAIATADKAAYLQDMNGWCYVHSYMLAYLLQQGIPEWDSGTTYFQNSVVQANGGQWFNSLQDNNLGNAPPVSASNAFWQWVNEPVTPPTLAVGNSLKSNLVTKFSSGTPAIAVDITADLLSVQDVILTGINLSANITVSGANGLDSGVEAASTWYAVHVITDATGSLVASLLSLSPSAPTLPVGYTKFRRVGWVRNNASGDFNKTVRVNDKIYYNDAALHTYSSPTGTVSFSADAPPTAQAGIFQYSVEVSLGSGGDDGFLTYKPTGASFPAVAIVGGFASFATNMVIAGASDLQISASQQADFALTGIAVASEVNVLGYYDAV